MKLTKKAIANKYFTAKGYKVCSGQVDDTLEAIAPWLVMDLHKSMYETHIRPLNSKHELRKIENRWRDQYNRFNMKLYEPFTEEEQIEIVDYMDDLENALKNDLGQLRELIKNQVRTDDEVKKEALAGAYCCAILAQIAWTIYRKVYYEQRPQTQLRKQLNQAPRFAPEDTPEIDACELAARNWMRVYSKQNGLIDTEGSPEITQQAQTLARKTVRWIQTE